MNTKQLKLLGNIVGITIGVDREGVISLFKKSGISVSSDISNDDLIELSIDQILTDPKFLLRFDAMFQKISKLVSAENGFDRYEAKGKLYASANGSFDWGGAITGLTGLGGSLIASSAQRKLAKEQAKIAQQEAQTAIALGANQLELEKIRLAQIQASKVTSGTGNTMLYVGIGLVGILVIGGLLIAIKK